MKRIRTVVTYKNYFQDFYARQNEKVQNKIAKTIEIIEYIDIIPERYLKHLRDGLFEIRIQLGSNIFRIFCFFDGKRFVILLGGFQKKTQKTPKQELSRALQLMKEYYKEKEEGK
ncbi:Phage-related protein [Porphyromonadaceae bacterium NLAE-zl-C104]|uniref:type II toxin-antitoxin system RelE/ParE family toxin n=1 Tax=Proteiniphilum TaxID=294702 RepID=UPI00089CCD50|nr:MULTISPECIES: type II toxin-antitoxin system RelE/ParE family toxin [Proteiniphilum]MDY9917591.1 type II toxin-antitoxin system RelE/ParE family toxin [Proteiniphilum sp.]SEA10548.1 Phage-related protein [Porphyromonadaceae bacterium KH3R12]SFS32799.1 Phage-related protein [Porphyromonadaceae bacterium NLAE-zl-C104]